jgi:hypothetical protein
LALAVQALVILTPVGHRVATAYLIICLGLLPQVAAAVEAIPVAKKAVKTGVLVAEELGIPALVLVAQVFLGRVLLAAAVLVVPL